MIYTPLIRIGLEHHYPKTHKGLMMPAITTCISQLEEIKKLKILLEEAETEKTTLKKKSLDVEARYDKLGQGHRKLLDKLNTCKQETGKIIHNLKEYLVQKTGLLKKWKPQVNESCGRLQALHQICPVHAEECQEFDLLYSDHEAKCPALSNDEEDTTEVTQTENAKFGTAMAEGKTTKEVGST